MPDSVSRNRRIAKNTMMLYVRMLLSMSVSLYTSRVVLRVLGIEDFGVYNVVGGAATMFSFLGASISTATQRFLSYELGQKDSGYVRKVFCMSINTHAVIAVAILLLVEAVGIWFINYKLNIPVERLNAANWVFQCAVLSVIISFICLPYTALIIAHERMGIYAYISIFEVVAKLSIVYLLQYLGGDKLILYAIFLLAVTSVVQMIYGVYCRCQFAESRYKFIWERKLFRQMFRHSNWMLLGTSTSMLSTQGVNMLINVFFNVTINAARGIAYQVYNATNQFVTNFMVAVQPQIIKQYAQGENDSMNKLIFSSSKFSFFLVLFIALPVVIEADVILKWWLKTVPDHAVLFTRLVVVDLLFTSLYSPIATLSQATGKIGLYQSVIAVGFLSVFLITWLLYGLGFPDYSTFLVLIAVSCVTLFARLRVLRKIADFPVKEYCRKVLLKNFSVALSALPLPILFRFVIPDGYLRFGAVLMSSVFVIPVMIWMLGLDTNEKNIVVEKLYAFKAKFNK